MLKDKISISTFSLVKKPSTPFKRYAYHITSSPSHLLPSSSFNLPRWVYFHSHSNRLMTRIIEKAGEFPCLLSLLPWRKSCTVVDISPQYPQGLPSMNIHLYIKHVCLCSSQWYPEYTPMKAIKLINYKRTGLSCSNNAVTNTMCSGLRLVFLFQLRTMYRDWLPDDGFQDGFLVLTHTNVPFKRMLNNSLVLWVSWDGSYFT